jgi:hypothetical protein
MAKQTSNGYVKVAWVLAEDLANPQYPTAAALNGALDLSSAIAWQDYQLGAESSEDIDDRALTDLGNAVSRGSANYSAQLSFFRQLETNENPDSVYTDAFQAFRVPRTLGYLVTRVAEKPASDPWAAGDTISVYLLLADVVIDQTSGDTSTKFQVSFLPQGRLFTNTTVGAAGVISGVPTTLALGVGEVAILNPVLAGKSIRSRASYSSSTPTNATVSELGVISGEAAGTSTITTNYGAATAPVTTTVTVS